MDVQRKGINSQTCRDVRKHQGEIKLSGVIPLALGEFVVGLVFCVGVEMEDALNEVLAEHFWVLLQQQVEQAVFSETKRR